ncbi:alpha/beta-hydrolase family protein [Antrihabitans cavernicola]|uniref:Alpha/beta-hydrolase catalytic domain-containing protein n=1 Tax=Antrihabitans cavernicola TaxID=2495913 RepID=A0A5A7SDH8_9NOCA|nr:alpha/beta-hydrolase family protein [Spelaeibacter cavernicola]KAA0024208.1 hypothetical protein FOY51_06615 [Spelaeibacter cavernicola]
MSTVFDVATRPLAAVRAVAVPRVTTSVVLTATIVASLSPSLLPRTPTMQAVLTGLFTAVGLGVASLLRRVGIGPGPEKLRSATAFIAAVTVAWSILAATRWQDGLRAVMGMQPIGLLYWVQTAAGAAFVAIALYGITTGIGWAAGRLGLVRGIGVSIVAGIALQVIVVPAVVGWRTTAYRAANGVVDTALSQPLSTTRSGSAESYVSWSTLGSEGRKFVSTESDTTSVRAYVGLDSAPDLHSRVNLAVRELERAGGLSKSAVVVAVPTGSGWVDANAVAGFERRFHDDVALVGMQYSYAPSWATFVFGRAAAEESAKALFTAVAQRLSELPPQHRPDLFIYGQSLGSVGGSAAFHSTAAVTESTCGALWAGPPAGAVDRRDATILANSSDPVVRWSPRLLVQPPDLAGTRIDAPEPQWIPVVSFLQTTVDLLGALNAPAGHGHRYGVEQGTAMPHENRRGCA